MVRVKRGNVARKKRAKVFQHTKGFKVSNSHNYRVAHQQYVKSLSYSYVGRKLRKRDFRRIWISRINYTVREEGSTYSRYVSQLKRMNIGLNRKMLSLLATYKMNLTCLTRT